MKINRIIFFTAIKALSFGIIRGLICRMTKSIDPSELLTVTQAADERGTSRQAINYLVRQGRLETVEIAGKRFISRSVLASFKPESGGRPPGKVSTANKAATKPANGSNKALTAAKAKKKGKR
jgi:hypothetical protein